MSRFYETWTKLCPKVRRSWCQALHLWCTVSVSKHAWKVPDNDGPMLVYIGRCWWLLVLVMCSSPWQCFAVGGSSLSLNVGRGRVVSLLTQILSSIQTTHPSPALPLSSCQSQREPVWEDKQNCFFRNWQQLTNKCSSRASSWWDTRTTTTGSWRHSCHHFWGISPDRI